MEFSEYLQKLNKLNLNWVVDEINLTINNGKTSKKKFEDTSQKKVIGLTTSEFTENEKIQLLVEWLFRIFTETVYSLREIEKIVNKKFDNSIITLIENSDVIEFPEKLPKHEEVLDLLHTIIKSSTDKIWKENVLKLEFMKSNDK